MSVAAFKKISMLNQQISSYDWIIFVIRQFNVSFRLIMGLVFAVVVGWAPYTKIGPGDYPYYYYLVVLFVYALHQVCALLI